MKTKGKTLSYESHDDSQSKGNEMVSFNVKTCQRCGQIFVEGYHGSLGVQFWLTAFTFFGGIAYWVLRGRGERCPRCKKRKFTVLQYTVTTDTANGINCSKVISSAKKAYDVLCPFCGRMMIYGSACCEGCGRKLV